MKLKISVLINGHWVTNSTTSFTAVYTLKSSNPQPNQAPVAANGDIDLRVMDPGNTYNNATDIEFSIDQQSTWTDSTGNSMNLSFTADTNVPPPVVITGTSASTEFLLYETNNPNSVAFTDTDDLTGEYNFCLNINSQYPSSSQNYIFPLDPKIINKGPGSE